MAKTTINVNGTEIRLMNTESEDFISLTDIAKRVNERSDMVIGSWLRNRNTLEFLGVWEGMHNPKFNPIEFDGIVRRAGLNTFFLSAKQWAESTGAVGIRSKAGGSGGTFAHRDIAFEFCSHISPVFKLYLVKEFQRLKEAEAVRLSSGWDLKRELARVNFHLHTEAVRQYLVPLVDWNTRREAIFQASEADLLNIALFGLTAREWQAANPDLRGNLRDHASAEQLLVMANIESLNTKLLQWSMEREQRLEILNQTAVEQMAILIGRLQTFDGGRAGEERLLG